MNRVDRRTFLVASAAVGLGAACGGGNGSADDETEPRSGRVEFLVPTFPTDSMVVAELTQRVAFVVRDDLDYLRTGAPDQVDIAVTIDGESVLDGPVPVHRDGLITPYYPVVFTPPRAGRYVATTAGAPPIDFVVAERGAVPLVQVGDPMRPVATPTVTDALGVDPICTRAVQCPFHEVSLDAAIASGRPTVLLVATPGFCQSDTCGPVVGLLIDEIGDRDDIAVVHAEVYVDPSVFETGAFPPTTPVVATYSLPFEPQLVVGGADGTVVARLDTTWDRAELADAINRL